MYTHICKECNTTFATRKKIQEFCSLSCASSFQYKQRKSKYPNAYFKEKLCKNCNVVFTPKSPSQLYCSGLCKGLNSYYLRNYGITEKEKERLKEKQNYKCAICGGEGFIMNKTGTKEKLVVDHDHSTGKIRGMLCHNCNRALGLFKDNIDVLQQAIEYLS